MRIPLKEVPIEVRRLAAQHLESLRGTELMNDADARLATYAIPIYRPDIKEVAYYEFTVIGNGATNGGLKLIQTRGFTSTLDLNPRSKSVKVAKKDLSAQESTVEPAIGFIIASNGRHDFPVSHWSLDRLPPSQQVTMDLRGGSDAKQDSKAARLYKLDTLAYVAENEKGELVGQSGQLPGLLSGLPHALDQYAGQIASSSARPLRAERDDSKADSAGHEVERSKDEPPNLKMSEEGGWTAFKEGYTNAFGPLLDHLRKRAARTWDIEDLIRKFGEGIIAGTALRVALLAEATVELTGEGAKYVEPTVEENAAGPTCLVLRARDVTLQQEADLDLIIRYGNGEAEKLRFFVVSRDVPSNVKAEQSRDNSDSEE